MVIQNTGLEIFKLGHNSHNMSISVENTRDCFSYMAEYEHGGTSINNQLHLFVQYTIRKDIPEETYTNMVDTIFNEIEVQINKARSDAKADDDLVVGISRHSARDGEQNVIQCKSMFRLEKYPCQRDLDFLFNNSRLEVKKGITAAILAVKSQATPKPSFCINDDIRLLKYDQQWQKQCFTLLFQHLGLTLPPYILPTASSAPE